METKLIYAAAMGGDDVEFYRELLEKDPSILDSVFTSVSETPLQLAVMNGNVLFAKEIIRRRPELASKLDSDGRSPLHMACARNNIEVVKLLLEADPNVCSSTDKERRTPLHVAAMRGRIEIIETLLQTTTQAIQERVDPMDTILHLCVKHNQLEALKLLIQYLENPTNQRQPIISVNSKDADGNTILHLAVANWKTKIIKYLLESEIGVEVNSLNNKGLTALDILEQTKTGFTKTLEKEIGDLFRDAGGVSRARAIHTKQGIVNLWTSTNNLTTTLVLIVSVIVGTKLYLHELPKLASFGQGNTKVNSIDALSTGSINSLIDDLRKSAENSYARISRLHGNYILGFTNETDQTESFPSLVAGYVGKSILALKSEGIYIAYIMSSLLGYLASFIFSSHTIELLGSLSLISIPVTKLPLKSRLIFIWILVMVWRTTRV